MRDRITCAHCNTPLVLPYGDEKSDILLAGEYPGVEEARRGVPFVGETGDILDQEMARVGIHIWECRLTNLWLHSPNKDANCYGDGVISLTREMEGRKVLLMGSDLAALFLGDKISHWAGMEARSGMFPKSVQFVMMSPNPAVCLHTGHGEFRLAVEKFAVQCRA